MVCPLVGWASATPNDKTATLHRILAIMPVVDETYASSPLGSPPEKRRSFTRPASQKIARAAAIAPPGRMPRRVMILWGNRHRRDFATLGGGRSELLVVDPWPAVLPGTCGKIDLKLCVLRSVSESAPSHRPSQHQQAAGGDPTSSHAHCDARP